MTTDFPPDTQPDAEEVAAALDGTGAPQGAADAHGLLCALLCVDPQIDILDWLECLDATLPTPPPQALRELHAMTRAQLVGDRFDLALWLPDDATPLRLRAAALAQWCQGFLGGLGLGGIGAGRLDGDAAEFIDDLAAIAQAGHTDEGRDAEQAERDYAELVEFVRAGTYLVREALQPVPKTRKPS